MSFADLLPILIAWLIAIVSPGPASLALVGTSMQAGRAPGVALALGIVTGSVFWALVAGLGLSAAMLAHAWLVEGLRYAGALYLAWLAVKSARSAMQRGAARTASDLPMTARTAYWRGLIIHLVNPKAVFFWGSLFAIAVPAGSPPWVVIQVGAACLATSVVTMVAMALIFSAPPIARLYLRARRGFEGMFAALFGVAAFGVLTARLG